MVYLAIVISNNAAGQTSESGRGLFAEGCFGGLSSGRASSETLSENSIRIKLLAERAEEDLVCVPAGESNRGPNGDVGWSTNYRVETPQASTSFRGLGFVRGLGGLIDLPATNTDAEGSHSLSWILFLLSTPALAMTQFAVYNGALDSLLGPETAEPLAHYLEFTFNVVSAGISFVFCMDNKLLCDQRQSQLIKQWSEENFRPGKTNVHTAT